MDFFKTVTGKVVGGLVGLIVVIAGISWWQMDASTKQMLVSGTGKIVSWFLIVILVPWATFFIISWVHKMDTNAAGAVLVFVYTAIEATILLWQFDWSLPGTTAKMFYIVGVL